MAFETGVRVDRYVIGEPLGQGGFGVLYRARDTELDREVAIKFLRPEHMFKAQLVQRFIQEARAAARIQHPGIVTVFESGTVSGTHTRADGTVYMTMELLAGATLSARIKQQGKLPMGIAIGFCRQIASALDAAHQAGIVHRDLKPQNVMLVRDPTVPGGERVKILDFGIAKLTDEMGGALQTSSLVMLGTPMYMSPEQCRSSARVDARADIYSLGCILFQMLCGRAPFDGDSGELIAKHQLVAPPSARTLATHIPSSLDKLVTAMLAKSSDERPQTMSSVIDVLDAIEEGVAPDPDDVLAPSDPGEAHTLAESPSARRNVRPWPGRTTLVAGAAIAIAAGMTVALVWVGDDKPAARVDVQAAPTAAASGEPADAAIALVSATDAPAPTVLDDDTQALVECTQYGVDRDWVSCMACTKRIEAKGAALKANCRFELENEVAFMALRDAVVAAHRDTARVSLELIEQDSVYYREARELFATLDAAPASRKVASQVAPVKPAKPGCDAAAARQKGLALIDDGQHASALQQFEASLACHADAYVVRLAFVSSCLSSNSAKATAYYKRLAVDQQLKYGPVCDRQRPPVAYQACDAEALKQRGMEDINNGDHPEALAAFEASLACRTDPYVLQLAFMEACAAGNSPKAKRYYKRLTPAQQSKFAQICQRQRPPVAYE